MPNSEKSNYINKPFMLNLDDPQERELYEWLKTQPPKRFKQETKKQWIKIMREEKKLLNEKPGKKSIAVTMNFWYNESDDSIHLTCNDFDWFHTTVNNKPDSERSHKNLYAKLERALKETGKL